MEIQFPNGDKFPLKSDTTTLFGRGQGYPTKDLTISRSHLKLKLSSNSNNPSEPFRIEFEVVGKNPLWVKSRRDGDGSIMACKKGSKGEMGSGDLFCLSGKSPEWFEVKTISSSLEGEVDERLGSAGCSCSGGDGGSDLELAGADIDPVKCLFVIEFGFLVVGHEFDKYPKKMIRDFKNFDWFLEESRKDGEDEEEGEKKRGVRRKRDKTLRGEVEDEDDEWTGESEEENELISKTTKVQRPTYITRSRDHKRPNNNKAVKKPAQSVGAKEEDEDTLGGFIVDDEEVEQEEESAEEEEEEFDEENDDD